MIPTARLAAYILVAFALSVALVVVLFLRMLASEHSAETATIDTASTQAMIADIKELREGSRHRTPQLAEDWLRQVREAAASSGVGSSSIVSLELLPGSKRRNSSVVERPVRFRLQGVPFAAAVKTLVAIEERQMSVTSIRFDAADAKTDQDLWSVDISVSFVEFAGRSRS